MARYNVPMSAYMVKTADGDRLVDGVEGLRELVLAGVITEDTQVRRGQRGKWRSAREVRGLATAFAEVAEAGPKAGLLDSVDDDPWAAWGDDLDEDEDVIDEVTGHGAFVPPDIAIEDPDTEESEIDALDSIEVSVDDIVVEAPKLGQGVPPPRPKKAIEPPDVSEPPAEKKTKKKGPKFVVESKPRARPEAKPPRKKAKTPPPGQVLSFPEGGRRRTRPARGNAVPKPADQLAREPVSKILDKLPPGRFYLYGGLVLATLMVVGVWRWWVGSLAGWTSEDPMGHGFTPEDPVAVVEPVVEPTGGPVPFGEPENEGDALADVLDDLKAEMVHDVHDLQPGDTSSFEDALFLELNQLVRVKRIEFEVLNWNERELPTTVGITVEVRSSGDTSRELGAVALGVGKYIGHYDWIVRKFDVELIDEDDVARQTSLDPKLAVRLYDDKIGLMKALGLE